MWNVNTNAILSTNRAGGLLTTKVDITGTLPLAEETSVILGGGTLILTIYDTDGGSPTWDATIGGDNVATTSMLDGLGVPSVIRIELDYTNVVRTSSTVVTITFPQVPEYNISKNDKWTPVFAAITNSFGRIIARNSVVILDEAIEYAGAFAVYDFAKQSRIFNEVGGAISNGQQVGHILNDKAPDKHRLGNGINPDIIWDEDNGLINEGLLGSIGFTLQTGDGLSSDPIIIPLGVDFHFFFKTTILSSSVHVLRGSATDGLTLSVHAGASQMNTRGPVGSVPDFLSISDSSVEADIEKIYEVRYDADSDTCYNYVDGVLIGSGSLGLLAWSLLTAFGGDGSASHRKACLFLISRESVASEIRAAM